MELLSIDSSRTFEIREFSSKLSSGVKTSFAKVEADEAKKPETIEWLTTRARDDDISKNGEANEMEKKNWDQQKTYGFLIENKIIAKPNCPL